MIFSLKNKNAIITGGARGIGKGIAKVFAAQGANVIILEVDKAEVEKTVHEINQDSGKAAYYLCNVASVEEVNKTFKQIAEQVKTIDILVNNAGIAHVGNIETTDVEDFNRVFQINAGGIFNCAKAAITPMKRQKSGVILNLASIVASIGVPDRFAYSMSKGAVVAMTLSIARDYVDDNIRCNCISPGRVHTPFVDNFIAENYPGREKEMFETLAKTQPIGRMGTTEEIGHIALYLCSDEASFITGNDYPIDGGFLSLKK